MTFTTALAADGARSRSRPPAGRSRSPGCWSRCRCWRGASCCSAGGVPTRFGHVLGTVVSWAGFVIAAVMFLAPWSTSRPTGARSTSTCSPGSPPGRSTLDAGLLIDPLSVAFVLLVTFVGSLIHVYSVAYMEHDPDRRRFFAYLNLFVASMLLLVLADSYLLLFVGWEGVGLASYLLIGFWNYNPAYATAAKKAFVVNRVGDFGLALAIMLMFADVRPGRLRRRLRRRRLDVRRGSATAMGLLAAARGLRQVGAVPAAVLARRRHGRPDPGLRADPRRNHGHRRRLPDRPVAARSSTTPRTPGSASSSSARSRCSSGPIVGCAKDDMKKALAASTMSQIGYMMLAAGLGPVGYAFAIFHLLTHGFFKAGMFLGAGSVMHGMNDQVDMRRFGGLSGADEDHLGRPSASAGWRSSASRRSPASGARTRSSRPRSSATAGGPGCSAIAALLGAGITAFYMSRLFFMTFHGKQRWTENAAPARVARADDRADDRPGRGLGGARLRCSAPHAINHWLAPVVGEAPDERRRSSRPAC